MIRRFLSHVLVIVLFLLGMLIADKQYIESQVIGFQYSTQSDLLKNDQLHNMIRTGGFSDKDDFINTIINTVDCDVVRACFNEMEIDGRIVPAGVYDTFNINQSEGIDSKRILVCSQSLQDRFQLDENGLRSILQRAYLWLLSFIGKIEIFLTNLFHVL